MAYDAKGRRDPFSPVSLALEAKGINVTAAKLVGIVQGRKGEESGNGQRVVEMRTDCDQDAIWLKVELTGNAEACCHTGRRSCFYRAVAGGAAPGGGPSLRFVDAERQFDPETAYRHADAAKRTLKSSE